MEVIPEKRAVVLRLRQPERVLSVIPTAKYVKYKGVPCVAVPHRVDETRVLRNLGFEVPSPMQYYYTWPGKNTPFQAQVETASFLTMNDRAFCLNSMGLGKTITALWAYDFLRRGKQVHSVLVVCPLSTMERTWADEAFRAFPELQVNVLYGTRERRLLMLAQPADIYIINIDGVGIIAPALKDRDDIDLVIVDELAMARNSSTNRWKNLNTICNKQTVRKVWGLTGSPIPNSPEDAWAQCRLVVPHSRDVPQYFNRFRDTVMRQISQFKWVPRKTALDTVHRCMQPAVRFALDDCVDLPPQVFVHRDAPLSAEQTEAYKTMLRELKAEYAGGQIVAVNEAIKQAKLVQISCGVAYDPNGNPVALPAKGRIDTLKELLEDSEGKAIVFVPLTGVLHVLEKALSKDYTVAVVHGDTTKAERDQIFKEFQAGHGADIILANPGTMSHGLTLTAATTIIWYAPITSNETWEQANARVRRPGQTKTTVIATIAATAVERKLYERLRERQSTQGTFLKMMEQGELDL